MISQADAAVVNEDYPADCIKYQALVNPDQVMYHIRGRPSNVVKEQEDTTAVVAAESLPLKPEKRANTESSPTPSHTEPSEQLSAQKPAVVIDTVACIPPSNQEAPGSRLQNKPADALDEAIDEMLAVKDLVSR